MVEQCALFLFELGLGEGGGVTLVQRHMQRGLGLNTHHSSRETLLIVTHTANLPKTANYCASLTHVMKHYAKVCVIFNFNKATVCRCFIESYPNGLFIEKM